MTAKVAEPMNTIDGMDPPPVTYRVSPPCSIVLVSWSGAEQRERLAKMPAKSSSLEILLLKAIEKPHSTYTTPTVAIRPKDIIIMFRTV